LAIWKKDRYLYIITSIIFYDTAIQRIANVGYKIFFGTAIVHGFSPLNIRGSKPQEIEIISVPQAIIPSQINTLKIDEVIRSKVNT